MTVIYGRYQALASRTVFVRSFQFIPPRRPLPRRPSGIAASRVVRHQFHGRLKRLTTTASARRFAHRRQFIRLKAERALPQLSSAAEDFVTINHGPR